MIPPKITSIAQGDHVLFDIDVKGKKKIQVSLLPSMPKGEIVGKCLTCSVCLSLMESTTMRMATKKPISFRANPKVQMKLKEIRGLMLHVTV
jgi:hypothetical protein